jgi:hypothetical protein
VQYDNTMSVKRYRDKNRGQPREEAPLKRIDAFVAEDGEEVRRAARTALARVVAAT